MENGKMIDLIYDTLFNNKQNMIEECYEEGI